MVRQIMEVLRAVFTWWVVIAPWQRAVRLRFGKHMRELGPGIHWKVPFLHRVFAQTIRIVVVDTPNQTLTTADGRVVTLSVVINFHVVDVQRMFMSIDNPRETVNSLAMGVVAAFISSKPATECSVPAIEKELISHLDAEKWGLEFDLVNVSDYAFVKTYRFITNESNTAFWSGSLDLQHGSKPMGAE